MSPLFSPVSAGGIGKATVTASTGATVDTSSRAGKTIYKFTTVGTHSITVGTSGTAEILVCGGGGGGAAGGGGAGGYIYQSDAVLPSGTLTVAVGAGGTNNSYFWALPGRSSKVGNFTAVGGGYGGNNQTSLELGSPGGSGGSGGGGYGNGYAGGVGVPGQGNNGATGPSGTSASGGGAGSAAGAAAGSPGAGIANSITGTSVTYCAGGNSQGSQVPIANTGRGGDQQSNGSSGIVVVVIG